MFDRKMMEVIAENDINVLEYKGKTYGDSWKKRGGVGAFMMLARKWDRIENQVKEFGWDVFAAVENQMDRVVEESLVDDIRDLRRYLLLVEEELIRRNTGDMLPETGESEGEATPAYVGQ